MLKNAKIQIFLPKLTIGFSYIIYNNQKYRIDIKTRTKVINKLKKIPKNELVSLKIDGYVKRNQYGYWPKMAYPHKTIEIIGVSF